MQSSSNITFVDATLNDADAILALVHQLEHFISKETLLINLKNNLERIDYRIFVAKENNTVMAFAELHFTQFIHEVKPRARITSFCVNEKFRNKKIGFSFLLFIEKFCIEHNYLRIELTSNVRRIDAHRFYENNDYSFASKRYYKEL